MNDDTSMTDSVLVDDVRQLLAGEPPSLDDYITEDEAHTILPAEVQASAEEAGVPSALAIDPKGIVGWLWEQLADVVHHVICGPDVYDQLAGLSEEEIKARVDQMLADLIAGVVDQLPGWLRAVVPLIRPLVARAIAYEVRRAISEGLGTYCAVPAVP
jgi:hypothetical protein